MAQRIFRTSNPAMSTKAFDVGYEAVGQEAMTVSGTVNKTFLLTVIVLLGALWVWRMFFIHITADPNLNPELWATQLAMGSSSTTPWLIGGAIGGLVMAVITIFKKTWSPVTAPLYAVLQGFAIGGISAMMEAMYPGIVIQAVGLTFGTLFALLLAYRAGLIKVTKKFRSGIIAATGGIFIVYLATMVLGFFGVQIPLIHGSGPVGIIFSLVVVVIAALNLVLDFDFIERGAERGAPKYFEWYGAFGLVVTLVWLYLEMLRLLAKLRSR